MEGLPATSGFQDLVSLFFPKVCRNLFQWPLEYDTVTPLSAHQWEMAIGLSLLGRTSDSKCPSADDFLALSSHFLA